MSGAHPFDAHIKVLENKCKTKFQVNILCSNKLFLNHNLEGLASSKSYYMLYIIACEWTAWETNILVYNICVNKYINTILNLKRNLRCSKMCWKF